MTVGVAVVLGLGLAGSLGAADAPQRVVSINLCTDLLVLELVPRERIASITYLAARPDMSRSAQAAAGIPLNYGGAEEVLALRPDLVVASAFTTRTTTALLEQLGVEVLVLEVPTTIEQTRRQLRRLARAVGEPARGEAILARLDADLDRARPVPGARRPLAVLYRANGFTAGPDSLAGALLEASGFDNVATRVGIRHFGQLPLEALLLSEPEVLVFDTDSGRRPALAWQILDHPALRTLRERAKVVYVPSTTWTCAGPWMTEAVHRLSEARGALSADGPTVNRVAHGW